MPFALIRPGRPPPDQDNLEAGGQATLPRNPPAPPAARGANGGCSARFSSMVGLILLTFNSGVAIYHLQGDPWGVTFTLGSYAILVLLFYSPREVDGEGARHPNSSWRLRAVQVCVWGLISMLAGLVMVKIATIWPLPVAVIVWFMAIAAVAGGFWAFFLY
ncbi:unnamed protein product [Urochloa humidicola]